jgi:parallel beta-helix repeat protein
MKAIHRRMVVTGAVAAGIAAVTQSRSVTDRNQADSLTCSINDLKGSAVATHVIAMPGVYYAEDNIFGTSGKCGIEIRADHVHIDLKGYSLLGVPGSLSGVIGAGVRGCVVTNGPVSHWGRCGIDLRECTGCEVERVTASYNGESGMRLNASIVRECVCSSNDVSGVDVQSDSVLAGCTCIGNAECGMRIGRGCRVSDSHVAGGRCGYFVWGRDNLLVRNTARCANGFSICAGNAYGPFVQVAGVGAVAAVPGVEHPLANITF